MGRAIEPSALIARIDAVAEYRDIGLAVAVVIADNRRIITRLAEQFRPQGVGLALEYVERRNRSCTRTPNGDIRLVVAIVIFRNEEVRRQTPYKEVPAARLGLSVGTCKPGNLAGRAAAGIANY